MLFPGCGAGKGRILIIFTSSNNRGSHERHNSTIQGQGNHPWKFFRVGGFDQVKLDTGADLATLEQLDQKLWVALSCPSKVLEFDAKTLELIDTVRTAGPGRRRLWRQ